MARISLSVLGMFAAAASTAVAIYPPDHWSYSTKVSSQEIYDNLVAKAVEGDHTLFVRWIASSG